FLKSRCETASCLKHIRDAVRQHRTTQPAEDDGKPSPPAAVLQLLGTTLGGYRSRLEDADKQVHDLLLASERLQDENQTLRQLTSDQKSRIDESWEASVKLEDEVARLRQESSDWSTRSRGLQAERQRERDERTAEVQDITDRHKQESTARLSFLYCLYQRLLAGCVLLHQPQSILGNFTWKELCDVIGEQVDQLTSDLRKANDEIAHLQSVCDKKSVCVRELQRSQECVLSRLEESVRRREEAWNSRHTHTMNQLERCRSQCDSLQDSASSLELRASSLTSDLSRSRRDSSSFLLGCTLLAGALQHAHLRLSTLSEQKALLSRRLADGELLEEQVRSLADALGGKEDEEEEEVKEGERRRRRAVRRWRRSVCAVLAVGRWRSLARKTTVLFRLERGGGASAVCVCGSSATATREGQNERRTVEDDADDSGDIVRWLRSKRLSSSIRSCMSGLQGALVRSGSSHPHVISAARSGLSRLLDVLLNQSASGGGADEDTLSGRLRLGLSRLTPPQPDAKALVSALQQHFLLFSQRLHTAEVERRGLRLEVANLKRGLRQEREEPCRTGFHSVCAELRESLSREKAAQTLIQEQSEQLNTLQRRVDTPTAEDTDTQRTLSQTTQALTEARRDVSRKERSLRILGKHLSGVQRERRQLEEKLQRAEDELRDATRRQDRVISCMKAAETSYKQVRDSLVQSHRSLTAQPRPLQLPLELSDAGSFIGAPEVAACQSLLSVVSQLCHTCSSRIDWLEQEVSAHRSHVTALRSELQDACLRDNLAFVPVAEFPETVLFADVQTPPPIPLSDSSKVSAVTLSSAPLETNPAPPAKLSPALSKPKTKEKKTKKSRGHLKSGGIG
ncbi:coiled-coil domain-containing protein 171, partial [Brachyistius frenatus]|uniref:coiled-coil domain-containing protein 171 n=1 Tax=Brachyistius frenatus TaxID=100188 RepID=UPI0037E8ED5B